MNNVIRASIITAILTALLLLPVEWNRVLKTTLSKICQRQRVKPETGDKQPEKTNNTPGMPPDLLSEAVPILGLSEPSPSSVNEVERETVAKPPLALNETAALREVATNLSEPKSQLAVVENTSERESAERKLDDLLRLGGDRVTHGVILPGLRAVFGLSEIQALLDDGLGVVLAEVKGELHKVANAKPSFVRSDFFVPLTDDARGGVSNRGWPLDALGTALQPLEERSQRRFGSRARFYFFPNLAFDDYLRRKQLGVLEDLKVPWDTSKSQMAVYTEGILVMTDHKPAYVVRRVYVSQKMLTYQDPEKSLIKNANLEP